MPAGDGTGPMGMGSKTGRSAGYCSGYTRPGFMNPMPGRGMGLGRGRGGHRHGWRNRFRATGEPFETQNDAAEVIPLGPEPAPADEVKMLKSQAGHLEQTLEELHRRIAELESGPVEEK